MKKRNYTSLEYTQEAFDVMHDLYEDNFEKNFPNGTFPKNGKELMPNDEVFVEITHIIGDKAIAETKVGQTLIIDIAKESKSIQKLGYPEIEIKGGSKLEVLVVKEKGGGIAASVASGYEKALKRDLLNSITDENIGYSVKIESLCPGGFMVDLSGIKCFMPGSLAAANRILDFASYIGKTTFVMVETYDASREIFVVSFKKYLKRILGSKVDELSLTEKYTGKVTGSSHSGVFVEWEEIYTGLIPLNELGDEADKYRPGTQVTFYVSDIKNPNRIVLSIKEPNVKTTALQDMKNVSTGATGATEDSKKTFSGKAVKIKPFGVFVKLDNGFLGLVEKKDLIDDVKDYQNGQEMNCEILDVDIASSKIQLREI